MRTRTLIAAGALAAGSLLAGAVLTPMQADPTAAAPIVAPDAESQAQQGMDLLQRSRDEAAPGFLSDAETALRASLAEQPDDNVAAFIGMASLANARHDFSGSVAWSRRAIKTNPFGASAYGLLGDSLFELGRIDAAADAYQRMVDIRPDTASYVRAAYTQQYGGDVTAAIRTMRLALQAAGPAGPAAAFVRHQLGDLLHGQGRYAAAAHQNRVGTKIAPGFVPPTVGLAEAHIARGRLAKAIVILERAVVTLPTIEYLTTLGDLYTAVGRTSDAAAVYDRAGAALAAYRRNGVLADADFIVFYADHGLRPAAALREARAIYRDRPTPKTADALAWMLHSLGRDDDARRYAQEAVRATGVSGEELFHLAQIELALGHDAAARRLLQRAVRTDPLFSVLGAATARRQLEAL